MLKTYKERFEKQNKDFLKECFQVINECCSTQPHGLLILGSHGIEMGKNDDENYVPFLVTLLTNERVELYSDEGYNKFEDIAHWTDMCLDAIMARAAGCGDKYSQMWGKENEK